MLKARNLFELLSVAAPKVANGACLVAANILLISFLEPTAYGIYSLCVASILIADTVLGSAIDLGVLRLAPVYRVEEPARSYEIEAAAAWLKVALATVAGAGLFATAPALASLLFGDRELTHILALTYLAIVAMLMLRSCLVHLQVDKRFAHYGVVEWLHTLLKYGGAALLFFVVDQSIEAVLVAFVAGPAFACTVGMSLFAWDRGWIFRLKTARLRELAGYVKWIFPVAVAGSVRDKMDVYFLAAWSSVEQVGIFSAARALAMVPELAGMYLGILFSPRIMPLHQQKRLYSLFKTVQIGLTVFAIGVVVVVIFAVEFIDQSWIPTGYASSVTVFLVLLLGAMTGFLSHPLVAPFLMFVRPRFHLYLDLTVMPLMVVGYAYAIDAEGAIGAAWVTTGARILLAGIAHSATWRWVRAG